MCRLVLAALAIASLAHAEPPAPVTWADWVGDYTGALAWTHCPASGKLKATVPLDASDGAMAIDLTAAGAGLRALSLVEDRGAFTAQQGDLTVKVVRPRADALDLRVELESGCVMHGVLRRASIGVAACDRLVAWSRIEAHCAKLATEPLERAPGLATWKPADAGRCNARAAKVEAELVDAGCAPDPAPQASRLGAACQTLVALAARYGRCANVPPDARNLVQRLAMVAVPPNGPVSELFLDAQCTDASELIKQLAANDHCPL